MAALLVIDQDISGRFYSRNPNPNMIFNLKSTKGILSYQNTDDSREA